MKRYIFLLLTLLLFSTCSLIKSPEFKGISGINIIKHKGDTLFLVANAKFKNPNLLGGKFKISDLKVSVNEKYMANLNSETYKVPTKKEFTIPLKVNFKKSFLNNSNILDILNTVFHNNLKVQYKGTIYYVSHGLNVPYKIDYVQDIKLLD